MSQPVEVEPLGSHARAPQQHGAKRYMFTTQPSVGNNVDYSRSCEQERMHVGVSAVFVHAANIIGMNLRRLAFSTEAVRAV